MKTSKPYLQPCCKKRGWWWVRDINDGHIRECSECGATWDSYRIPTVLKKGLKIAIDEEYGYRFWVWLYPGTVEQLEEDWREGKTPWDEAHIGVKQTGFRGRLKYGDDSWFGELNAGKRITDIFDARSHMHEREDTYLYIYGRGNLLPSSKR